MNNKNQIDHYDRIADALQVISGDDSHVNDEKTPTMDYYDRIADALQTISENNKLKTIKDYITPEIFGAKGDGVTDDTTSIQLGINKSIELNIPFKFLGKTYLISSPIIISSNEYINISGVGQESIITNKSGEFTPYANPDNTGVNEDFFFVLKCQSAIYKKTYIGNFQIKTNTSAGGIKIYGYPGPNALFENIGFYDLERTTIKYGIYARSYHANEHGDSTTISTEIVCTVFKHLMMRNVKGAAIFIGEMYTTTIKECDFVYCDYGVYISSGSNNVIDNCRIDEGSYGIYCNGATFNDSSSQESIDNTKLYPYFTSTQKNLTIRNCRFERDGVGVTLIAYGTTYFSHENITIDGNYFSHLCATEITNPYVPEGQTAGTLKRCRALIVGRIDGLHLTNNSLKGMDEEHAGITNSWVQNIRSVAGISNVYFDNNKCILQPSYSDPPYYKSNSKFSTDLATQIGFVNDIEASQSSITNISTGKNLYKTFAASISDNGVLDPSANYIIVSSNTTITGIATPTINYYKEITLIFTNDDGCTVKNTANVRLAGNTDFIATKNSTLTLVSCYISGVRWIEKSRSIY